MITERRAIDGLRRTGRTGRREIYAPLAYENHPDFSNDPEVATFELDHTVLLGAAVRQLPVRQREAVDLLVFNSHSLPCAAAVAGRTTGSLRVNWHRALKTLRAQLGRKD